MAIVLKGWNELLVLLLISYKEMYQVHGAVDKLRLSNDSTRTYSALAPAGALRQGRE